MRSLAYVHDTAAPLAARAAALASARAAGRETPGAYIRNRRAAAGLTRAQVAKRVAAHFGARAWIEAQLADLESDRPGDYLPLVRSLKAHRAFAFNLATFVALAAATCAPALGEWEPA